MHDGTVCVFVFWQRGGGGEYLKRKVPESKRGSICDESLVGADEPVTPNERVVTKASGRSAGRCEAAGTAAR